MKKIAFGIVAGLVLLSGCSFHPLVPPYAYKAGNQQHAERQQHTERSQRLLVGVDVAANSNFTEQQAADDGRSVLGYIRSKLHGAAVGIVWDLCSPGFHSDSVRRCTRSLAPADVRALAREAATDGLQVQLRPLIRVGRPSSWNDPGKSWEGHLQPPNSQAFARSLLAAERPYLAVARQAGARQFVVGTELAGWKSSRWRLWLLGQVKRLCGCEASYAYNTGDIAALSSVTGAGGLDYYPTVHLSARASQANVTNALEGRLATVPASVRAQLTLDEVSIVAEAGAYQHPAVWNDVGRSDPTVQVRWFTGICQAARKLGLAGVYFYEIPLTDNIAKPDPFPAFFVGNAGSRAIARCSPRN